MVQNTADCTALVLRHFPSLNLRMPTSGVMGQICWSQGTGCNKWLSRGMYMSLWGNNNSGATWHPEVISVCPGVPCSQNRQLEALREAQALWWSTANPGMLAHARPLKQDQGLEEATAGRLAHNPLAAGKPSKSGFYCCLFSPVFMFSVF